MVTEKDVFELNKLQCLNTQSNLYFNSTFITEIYVKQLCKTNPTSRPKTKIGILESKGRKSEEFIMYTRIGISADLKLDFVGSSRKGRREKKQIERHLKKELTPYEILVREKLKQIIMKYD